MIDLIRSKISYIYRKEKHLLKNIVRGIERESLRVQANSNLAVSSHPSTLGKSLTHKFITTDYAETLLEIITPTFTNKKQLIEFLYNIHNFVINNINGELLWPSSMPVKLPEENLILLADYGSSNRGKIKSIYREGLTHRYGKSMQMISGIHYNFSLPEKIWHHLADLSSNKPNQDVDLKYFTLIRNFHRYAWVIPYLFGSSPIIQKKFITEKYKGFIDFDEDFVYLPYATSLRMSDFGYNTKNQKSIEVNYNSLNNYIKTLVSAIKTPHQAYTKIGVCNNGIYKQLNDGLLQIENEFYNIIRPKRSCNYDDTQLYALYRGGVEYIEVRCLDCDPFSPVGIEKSTISFMDIFLLFCALGDEQELSAQNLNQSNDNFQKVVYEGRNPSLILQDGKTKKNLKQWLFSIIEALLPIAEVLDKVNNSNEHKESLMLQKNKVLNSESTPSAKIISYAKNNGLNYNDSMLRLAKKHQQELKSNVVTKEILSYFKKNTLDSIEKYDKIESNHQLDFTNYLKLYFNQYDLLADKIRLNSKNF